MPASSKAQRGRAERVGSYSKSEIWVISKILGSVYSCYGKAPSYVGFNEKTNGAEVNRQVRENNCRH